jgi:hypothetical protein
MMLRAVSMLISTCLGILTEVLPTVIFEWDPPSLSVTSTLIFFASIRIFRNKSRLFIDEAKGRDRYKIEGTS